MPYPSLLFIHGAATGAWVWDVWRRHLKPFGWEANVLDLRGHGRSLPVDLSMVTMEDYVSDVESVTAQIISQGRHPILIGWSMGGLVAMMYAAKQAATPALVLLSPSPPAEVAGRTFATLARQTPAGPYGPEVYGIDVDDPAGSRAALADLTDAEAALVAANSQGALDSGVARRQRRRGISIPAGSIRCPTLIVFGEEDKHFGSEQNRRLAAYIRADAAVIAEAGHWGIVYHEKAVAEAAMKVHAWLRRVLRP